MRRCKWYGPWSMGKQKKPARRLSSKVLRKAAKDALRKGREPDEYGQN